MFLIRILLVQLWEFSRILSTTSFIMRKTVLTSLHMTPISELLMNKMRRILKTGKLRDIQMF